MRIRKGQAKEFAIHACQSTYPEYKERLGKLHEFMEEVAINKLPPQVICVSREYPDYIGVTYSIGICCEDPDVLYLGNQRIIWGCTTFPVPYNCRILTVDEDTFIKCSNLYKEFSRISTKYQNNCLEIAERTYRLGTWRRVKEFYSEYANIVDLLEDFYNKQ